MSKQKRKEKKKDVSRRDFIRTTATVGTVAIAGMSGIKTAEDARVEAATLSHVNSASDTEQQSTSREQTFPRIDRQAVIFAIGDTLIPSVSGDPGYKDLEWRGITEEINRRLEEFPDADLELFNRSSL